MPQLSRFSLLILSVLLASGCFSLKKANNDVKVDKDPYFNVIMQDEGFYKDYNSDSSYVIISNLKERQLGGPQQIRVFSVSSGKKEFESKEFVMAGWTERFVFQLIKNPLPDKNNNIKSETISKKYFYNIKLKTFINSN